MSKNYKYSYCKAEEMYLDKVITERELNRDAFLPLSFEFLKSGDSQESVKKFWSHYSYYVYCTKVHFMEHALLCGISLLKEGRFDEAKLCIEPFEKLRPLLLLAGWDLNPEDAEYKSKLINLLWSEIVPLSKNGDNEEEDKFGAACNDLKYILDASRWSAGQLMKHEDPSVSSAMDEWKLTNEVMKLVPKHSLPFILSKCIENVSPSETIERIERNPNKNAASAISQDVTLMQSYEVLHAVFTFMTSDSGANGSDSLKMEDVPQKVRSIESCWGKVALLQEMFCVLFLKDDVTGDFIASAEKCSTLLSVLKACISDISDDNSGRDEKTIKALARLRADIREAQSRFAFADALYKDGTVTTDGVELPSVFVRTLLADPNDLLALATQFRDYELADKIKAEFREVLDNELVKASEAGKVVDDALEALHGGATATDIPSECGGGVVADIAFQAASSDYTQQMFKAALEKLISEEDQSYARVVSLMDAMVSGGPSGTASPSSSAAEAFALYSGKFAQNSDEQVRLMAAKASLKSAVEMLMNVPSGDERDAESDRKAIEEIQKALDCAKDGSFDCISVFLDYITRVTEVIKESKLPTYFGVLSKRPDELIRDLVFYNHNYKTASQLADLFHLDLDSILIEEVAGKIGESCFADSAPADAKAGEEEDKMIYHFAAYLEEKWPNLSILMTLLKSPSDEFHPELVSHALKCAKDTTPLGSWVKHQRRHFEIFYRVFCCDSIDLSSEAEVDFASLETPIKLSPRGAEALKSLHRWEEKSLGEFYCCVIDEMCEHGMGMEALDVADKMMPNGAPDYLLEKVASCVPPESSWKYIERIKDPLMAGTLSLESVRNWDDISICL